MSTSVRGIKAPDAKWKKMKAVYDACAAAKLEIPREVNEYFNWDVPSAHGVVVEIDKSDAVDDVEPGHPECGYRIDLRKLDKDIAFVEVINSW